MALLIYNGQLLITGVQIKAFNEAGDEVLSSRSTSSREPKGGLQEEEEEAAWLICLSVAPKSCVLTTGGCALGPVITVRFVSLDQIHGSDISHILLLSEPFPYLQRASSDSSSRFCHMESKDF
ncbi:uncharacterized [Tachysurus ichikawai]